MTKKSGTPAELISLFPERIPEDLLNDIPIGQIDVSDAVDPVPEFVESVRKFGIIQPVLLCKKSAKSEQYEVLAGRRRVLAARIVGLEIIPAIVRSGIYYADARASALTLEAQRHYNPNPIAEYRAIKKLVGEGYTLDQICSTLGLSLERIAKLMQLGTLPDNILDAVQERKVSVTTAHTMSKMAPTYQKKAVEIFNKSGSLTGSNLAEIKTAHKSESAQDVMKQVAASTNRQPTLREKIEALRKRDANFVVDERVLGWNEAINSVLELLD